MLNTRYVLWVTFGLTGIIALDLYFLIDRYAVNLMLWDQWEFYRPIFNGGSLWEIFNYQHGPHRQGIGGLLILKIAQVSGWDSRWDAFAVAGTLTVAAAAAVFLAKRCGTNGWSLCVIPLLLFNIRQYEGFVFASNVSHGAMPVLLLVLLSFCWFIQSPFQRYLCISLLTFALIFTGFGLFAGLLTPLVLFAEAYLGFSEKKPPFGWYAVGAIALVIISWLLFLHNYHFAPAVSEYRFPHERPWEYGLFVATMLSNFYGLAGHGFLSVFAGIGVAFFLVYLSIFYGLRIIRDPHDIGLNRTVFCLAAFTLVFCVQTAIGRTCLGWESASRASRYVTLMIPGGLAIGLHLATIKSRFRPPWVTLAYGALLVIGTMQLRESDWMLIKQWHDGRETWKETYLHTHDQQKANEASQFTIFPGGMPEAHMQFLEKHRLNLFKPAAPR